MSNFFKFVIVGLGRLFGIDFVPDDGPFFIITCIIACLVLVALVVYGIFRVVYFLKSKEEDKVVKAVPVILLGAVIVFLIFNIYK